MTDQRAAELELLRNRFCGQNFKKLLAAKGITKYRISKDCGISYRSLCYWQRGAKPNDANALLVARYLGLISPEKEELLMMKKEVAALQEKIDRIKSESDSISK